MTSIIKRQPTKTKNFWDEFFNEDFENMFSLVPRRMFSNPEITRRSSWYPRVNVHENTDSLVFEAEIPGMKKEDVDVTIENNILSIKGELKFEKDDESKNYHRIERYYGSFDRAFTLPNNVKVEDASADFADGVLTISLPKKSEAKPRKITIGKGHNTKDDESSV